MPGEVLGEYVDEPGGDGDGAACRFGLWLPESDFSLYVAEVAFDPDGPFQRFVVLTPKTGELPKPRPGVGGCEDQSVEPRIDGISEMLDLGGGEEPLVRLFDPGQLDALARGAGNESRLDGDGEDPTQDLVGFANGGRRISRGGECGDPFLDGDGQHVGKPGISERGQDEAPQIGVVSSDRGTTPVEPAGLYLKGPLGHGDLAKLRVGPIAARLVGFDGGCEQLSVGLPSEGLVALLVVWASIADAPGMPFLLGYLFHPGHDVPPLTCSWHRLVIVRLRCDALSLCGHRSSIRRRSFGSVHDGRPGIPGGPGDGAATHTQWRRARRDTPPGLQR